MEQRITRDPKVAEGKPAVAGTHLTVEHILERLGAGETVEELLQAHPRLTRAGIQAAFRFAAALLRVASGSTGLAQAAPEPPPGSVPE